MFICRIIIMATLDSLPSAAEKGFKDASAYDAHRPSYPDEAVERFLEKMQVTGQSDINIVEIASGTGKFTEVLAKRPERFLIKAIEPHETMRQKLVEKDLPAVEVVNGSANKMPVEEEWGDVCIAAQVRCTTFPESRTFFKKRFVTNMDRRHSTG